MAHEKHRISSEPRGQTTEKARKWRQPSMLHFVNVAVTPSRAHFPVRDAKEEKSIRAHVMKDYLQHRSQSSKPGSTSPAVSKLSDHLSRFRLPLAGERKGSRRGTREISSEERTSASALIKMRAIMPEDHQSLRDVVLSRSLANNMLSNFPSPISTSTPGTIALLEYYYWSFWDNSLAVNPEGKWMSVAASDPAMFHATLCLVALHKVQTRREPRAKFYFWHRGEAMRLISQNLADPEQATSDATIGAVAVLSASDNSMHWPSITQTSHIEGMFTLVGLRGGIQGMETNRHIQRVVAWADVLHATAHHSRPQLGLAQQTAHCERQRLKDVAKQHRYSIAAGRDAVPAYFEKVLEDLRALATAKSLLVQEAGSNLQELRLIFSSHLFATEHRILELGHADASSDSVMGDVAGVEAVKAAALIFTFYGLRDIAVTASFFDGLVSRLRDGLCGVFDRVFTDGNPANANVPDRAVAAPFLLWLCVNGWKASAVESRGTDGRFFVETAAVLCERAGIDSGEELESYVGRIVFMAEYYGPACDGLWKDIKAWNASCRTLS